MISRFFIDRPVFAAVLSIALTLSGTIALFSLPVAQYPEITPPTVQVSVGNPGASAQVVADTVAAPIEQQVNGVDHMIYMCSTSDNTGDYNLIVTFEIGTNLNDALVAVQNRVNLALPQLPESVQRQGLTIKKKSPNILLAIAFFSPDGRYDDLYLSNYATIHVKDEVFRLEGVGDIVYLGERDYSIRVWLDPQEMASRNLAANAVVSAIRQQNRALAPGQVGQPPAPAGQSYQYPLGALGRLETVEQFGDIIVRAIPAGANGPSPQVVRLRDVARVELGAQKYDQSCTNDGLPAVALAVYQLPGTNALDVAKRVKAKMRELKTRFPEGLDYAINYDTTPFIRDSVLDVVKTLRDAVVLVALVVLLFLQNWRATLIPLVAVPVAIVGTFTVMAALGFSINNISLFGLVLAIGIVVDDAIVVVENVERWLEQGLTSKEAARRAMDEVTGPVVAVALVLCAVFVPCAFISGITGQFFRQFAVTIAISTVFSAFNSLTLSPALAALLLRPSGHHGETREVLPRPGVALLGGLLGVWEALYEEPIRGHWGEWLSFVLGGDHVLTLTWKYRLLLGMAGLAAGWFGARLVNRFLGGFFRLFNAAFAVGTNGYTRLVGGLVRVTLLVFAVYGGLLWLTAWGFGKVPTGFIPQQDQGWLMVNVQLPDSASVQRTQEVMARVEQIALKTKGVAHTLSTSGLSLLLTVYGSNYASMFVILDPFEKRKSPELQGEAIMAALRRSYRKEVRDAVVTVFGAPPVNGLGTAGGFKVMVEDRGDLGPALLQQAADKLILEGRKAPGLVGLFTLYRANTPQLYADIDRANARSLGVTVKDISDALEAYVGSLYVNNFNAFGRFWQVNVMADLPFRNDNPKLHLIKLQNDKGEMAPLAALLDLKETMGPGMVMRYNLYPAAPVNGSTEPGTSSGEAITTLDALAARDLPPAVRTEWTELSFLQLEEAGDWRNKIVFPLAVVFVFLVLAALYESWALPLAVILVVPMCLLCSLAGVALAHLDVNIFTQIGFVVLVGLASKNAILIVEFARQLRPEGRPLYEATTEACRLRLRPILMTSLAFILGVVPLVVAEGAGWEMRRALGTAVFSGMLGVTVFGILLTPVFFYAIGWVGERELFRPVEVRWILSVVFGSQLGLGLGILLVLRGLSWHWAIPGGLGLGALAGVMATRLLLRRKLVRALPPVPADEVTSESQ
jgi:multidrug efflux pump subunit AcrB